MSNIKISRERLGILSQATVMRRCRHDERPGHHSVRGHSDFAPFGGVEAREAAVEVLSRSALRPAHGDGAHRFGLLIRSLSDAGASVAPRCGIGLRSQMAERLRPGRHRIRQGRGPLRTTAA